MSKVEIAAVGDITLGSHLLTTGFGVREAIGKKGSHHVFKFVKPLFEKSDIAFGNLECVLSEPNARESSKAMFFRGSAKAVESLNDGGFDILNVANNHSLHHGIDAFNNTTALLKAQKIHVLGIAGDKDYSSAPVVCQIRDANCGFLAYSFVREDYHKGRPLYAFGDHDNILQDIVKLKKEVDFVIVSCHWGLERIDRPSLRTIQLARAMVDHGADVIFGHHPHVFQAVEGYKQGLILYSLGNFVFDCLWERDYRRSAIAIVRLEKGKAIQHELVPIHINSEYQPVPMTNVAGKEFLEHVAAISDKRYYDDYEHVEDASLRYNLQAAECDRREMYHKIGFVIANCYRMKFSVLVILVWEKLIKRLFKL